MLMTWKNILPKLRKLRSMDKKICFTNGCFDIIHAGHVTYLMKAKRLGDILIVGLNSDESVRRLKGNSRPINDQSDRAFVLSALKPVDYVVIFDQDTPYELVDLIKPDIIVKGGDYTPETVVGADIVTQKGGEVVIIPLVEGKSTTKIVEKASLIKA
jgi:rfaE bifunctional protein nucleotidyltransferase chain/domain